MEIRKISTNMWEIPKEGEMNVAIRIFANEKLIEDMKKDDTFKQAINVTKLTGILNNMIVCPDGHMGYGVPIGGVAAFDLERGIITPGGVGFDIDCSVRLLSTNLKFKDIEKKKKEIIHSLFRAVPSGVGRGSSVKLTSKDLDEVLENGAAWAVNKGYGTREDLLHLEENGKLSPADAKDVSKKAKQRGIGQLGTLGAGNHFLEIQVVDEIFDKETAKKFGLMKDQICVMIHCLPGNSKILTEYGYTKNIDDFEKDFKNIKIKCLDTQTNKIEDTNIEKFIKVNPYGKIYKIKTISGKELTATEDHPVLTREGLKFVKELGENDFVAVSPFEGVKYETPSDEIIIDEKDIWKIENNERIITKLKKKGLLPLRYNSPQLPILTKLLGFLTGDGWLGNNNKRICLKFIGEKEDLETIQKDLEKIDYHASKIYTAHSKSHIEYTDHEKRCIEGDSNQIVIESLSLPILFRALGAPFGNKSKNEFEVPSWIFNAPLWIKRLYLAGYFGAEMTKPLIRKKEKYRFGNPTISMNKLVDLKDGGKKYLIQIATLLKEFDVNAIKITEHKGIITKSGEKTIKLRLKLSSKEEDLRKLWSNIGFEYCNERIYLSSYALQYLNLKKEILRKDAIRLNKPEEKLAITSFKFRSSDCLMFEEFLSKYQLNHQTPIIWDLITKKEEVKEFDGYVYDFRVFHKDHNFIAEGFVTGNCGSRGLGHQVTSDYIRLMDEKYGHPDFDRELVNAPIKSELGEKYFSAMNCAANFAFANKQVISHNVREQLKYYFPDVKFDVVYEVCHNIAKKEKHIIEGKEKEVLIMRKGSTRAFPGQPVLIPGSMGTSSYVLVGTSKAMELSFGSTAHGAGRLESRSKAMKELKGEDVKKDLNKIGIDVEAGSLKSLAEEAPSAYKDIDEVVRVSHEVGIGKLVAKLKPIAVMKG